MDPLATMPEGLSAEDQQAWLAEAMRDGAWRLSNLYHVMDKAGRDVLFRPNAIQQQLLEAMWYRNVVLKARQTGISTLVQLLMLDACLTEPNTRAAVVAQDQTAAVVIFRDKVKYAYDHLPDAVKAACPIAEDRADELVFANNSSIRVATSFRSGTLQYLHVSEFGKICKQYPEKAIEVMTGSLPAVDQAGMVFIESTSEGRDGQFYDMVQIARRSQQAKRILTRLDMRFHFFAWWRVPEYRIDPPAGFRLEAKDEAYFARLEVAIGQDLDLRQRYWYVKKRETDFAGDPQLMMREYPSTPDEAFSQSTEGAYYRDQLARARQDGRIGTVPVDPRYPVSTLWDIGTDDAMALWFFQELPGRTNFIDYFEASGEPPAYYAKILQDRGYVYGPHYLPHDGAQRRVQLASLLSYADMLETLGLRDVVVVDRIDDVTRGIQIVRQQFHTYWFDETRCAEGLKHLEAYRKEWNERTGAWSARPRHDEHSHGADAFRQHAQAKELGLIDDLARAISGGRARKVRRRGSAMAA